jgi:hypothetical protein
MDVVVDVVAVVYSESERLLSSSAS